MPSSGEAQRQILISLIAADAARMRVLELVHDLALPDCWIGAGFVRTPLWDHLHGRTPAFPDGDVDVIWFDKARATPAFDDEIEVRLRACEPDVDWSVKNQARMHLRNGDEPYSSTDDAMRHWPETATAVAVRLVGDHIEILAPFGLDDLFSLTVRPTPAFEGTKRPVFERRALKKRWSERWPQVTVVGG
ncbi:MAG: nucleotidyltransferase family protein [Proteobacteria bacterium]|nr:nucleotidyltransferase family protein [Pseudomonadota bacterium]